MTLAGVFLLAFALCLPFGYWRAGLRRFSWQWFVAIHAPVPVVAALRLGSDLSWKFIPLMLAACVGGQLLGARFGRR